MLNLLVGFFAFGTIFEHVWRFLSMLFFVKETHANRNDPVKTEQVIEFVMDRMLICEGYAYPKQKTTHVPQGLVIGNLFVADFNIRVDEYETAVDITFYYPRWSVLPWHNVSVQMEIMSSAFDNNCEDDTGKSRDTEYDSLSKTNNYVNSHYSNRRKMMLLRTQHDIKTYDFAQGFVRQNIDLFKYNGIYNYRIILYGPPGTGKTTIAKCITLAVNGILVHVNPTVPGSNIAEALGFVEKQPLVVLFDEADKMILDAQMGMNQLERETRRDVYDKSSWNALIDGIKDLPNVILVLTMNSTPPFENCKEEKVLGCDPCFVRKGRFDKIYEIKDMVWVEREPVCMC